ncbi:MAG: hypothetical protein J6Q14_02860 [Oscillospiraceae bacterium]|nr:hypothetical protein [Oscillospiraceae bacterium]
MMTKKVKFTQRIANAVRALRGEPWPTVFEAAVPKVEATPLRLETFQVEQIVPLMVLDMQGQETIAMTVRRDLASLIGKGLMDAGAIEITKNVDLDRGTLTFRGRVRVAMPEEEKHG